MEVICSSVINVASFRELHQKAFCIAKNAIMTFALVASFEKKIQDPNLNLVLKRLLQLQILGFQILSVKLVILVRGYQNCLLDMEAIHSGVMDVVRIKLLPLKVLSIATSVPMTCVLIVPLYWIQLQLEMLSETFLCTN